MILSVTAVVTVTVQSNSEVSSYYVSQSSDDGHYTDHEDVLTSEIASTIKATYEER